ncbi:glycoside hydrolase family 5 protein [Cylindrobasidium torrendii FP15055 ss-10]|uniref:glucan 1,3-beta-glucosidase n=1 Tax=Cylindrobasidium torrendii FP15055 ss-10 TaxID=1314674 RepID=A0A0D7BMI8_9AGAR|nr:glycoside hydrolase family 5 protein [Cylindrobasidium torrendii FP15055 ss-10]
MSQQDLGPPRASFLLDGQSSNATSLHGSPSPTPSTAFLRKNEASANNEEAYSAADTVATKPWYKRPVWWAVGAAAVAVIVVAIAVPVALTTKNGSSSSSSGSSNDGGSGGGATGTSSGNSPGATSVAITGGDGSKITTEDGKEFTYENKFGGYWVADPKDPFNNGAKANSWTPALNETWTWGKDRAWGVNAGGWFVLEPFISPALFQKYPGAVDEWTLMEAGMKAEELEEHYKTFITEEDFAQMAGAGLNFVRLPIPYWAVETWEGEPFLERVAWKYILKAFEWARKYGLRINLDLHSLPGSQNGYNHSGRLGQVNFLYGPMGVANADRALEYIRTITEFISQPEYEGVVAIWGFVNEALMDSIGRDTLMSWYKEVHDTIRAITGVGKGPYISIHDGFYAADPEWIGALAGADRLMMDRHPYTSFGGGAFDDPIATGTGADAGGVWTQTGCDLAGLTATLSQGTGVTFAGEFSNGWNDCGFYLKGIPGSHTFGGSCDTWEDASTWDDSMKAGVKAYGQAQMDALQDYFFWTWRIGERLDTGVVGSPLWSYKAGLEGGWISQDPRENVGKCGTGVARFDGDYQPYMTGGTGAGTITAAVEAWPPATIAGADLPATQLFQYTMAGTPVTLPGPTATGDTKVDGWANDSDNGPAPTQIPGCTYPDAWRANDATVPSGCTL